MIFMTRVNLPIEDPAQAVPGPDTLVGRRTAGMADQKTLQNVEGSLSRIEGPIIGIKNMTAEGRICVDIVTQIAAVRAALNKVADMVVADHVQQWLNEASQEGGKGEQDLEELLKVFNQYFR